MSAEPSSSSAARPAPPLVFDDGSRAMMENPVVVVPRSNLSSRLGVPSHDDDIVSVREYYEVDRLVQELQALVIPTRTNGDSWSLRVALQFPDELLPHAPAVCELLQASLGASVLVFCLGDTTYAPCCADLVAAAHLSANVLVHYGHACFSSSCSATRAEGHESATIPVVYSFGKQPLRTQVCAHAVSAQARNANVERVLVLYQVQYAHAIHDLQSRLQQEENDGVFLQVVMGTIPSRGPMTTTNSRTLQRPCQRGDDECCGTREHPASRTTNDNGVSEDSVVVVDDYSPLVLYGGLELPKDIDNWSEYAVLFVGSDTSRQFLNSMLRFLSGTSQPQHIWTYEPMQDTLSTTLSPSFHQQLRRRYYLVQKAKSCAIFGILVANVSDPLMRMVVASLRHLLERHGRTPYVLVVGKINPAKLANFAEIDCFVLLACPEHSLLEVEQRGEFHIPVITPLELCMALGVVEWGTVPYSLDRRDFLVAAQTTEETESPILPKNDDDHDGSCDDEDEDAPYFSLVTGRYESTPTLPVAAADRAGPLIAYRSAAADVFKQRDYQGLEVDKTVDVHVAVMGQVGIASDYGER
jgi:diphthamide biosynthesis protein 2